jgi:hypothetical protein
MALDAGLWAPRGSHADGDYFDMKRYGYCGVYRLIGLASEGDLTQPAPPNRLCGQDTTGTLYIGSAKSLHGRLNQLSQWGLATQLPAGLASLAPARCGGPG